MNYKIYTVFDTKVGAYMTPWVSRSKGEAIRSITNELDNPNSILSKHPEDFVLFEIAEFDDQSAVVTPLTPTACGVAIEFKKPE